MDEEPFNCSQSAYGNDDMLESQKDNSEAALMDTDGTAGETSIPVELKNQIQSDPEGFSPTNVVMGGTKIHVALPNEQLDAPVGEQTSEDTPNGRMSSCETSLLHALSDPITGLLMEDAMVAQCGHSFDKGGLQRVREEKQCLICGTAVSSDLLIPNYALREAVCAYKEVSNSKKDLSPYQENSLALKSSQVNPESAADLSHAKGAQFPYVANDRVLIKGNKRTPERFVGREAIITTQCLNGWYLVRTLDTGESVRLQYRSLQKVEGSEVANGGNESLEDPKQLILYSKKEKLVSDGGETSSNTSQDDLQGDQERSSQEDDAVDDSADEDLRATKRTAMIGTSGDVEGSTNMTGIFCRTVGECHIDEFRLLRKADCNSGENSAGRGSNGGRAALGKCVKTRLKHSVLQSASTPVTRSEFHEADPYKKVYMSGYRRRTANNNVLNSSKEFTSASLNTDVDYHGSLPVHDKHHDVEMKNTGQSNCLQNATYSLETLKKCMYNLESEIPWDCMARNWKICHNGWLEKLEKSNTIQEMGKRLQEFRKALLLEKAGTMSDEEWNKKLEFAVASESQDEINGLWERLHDDVSKWIESRFRRNMKPLSDVKDAFLDYNKLEKLLPQLYAGGLSHTGVIAAASITAAEAFADGDMDMETLLRVPMWLICDRGNRDLLAVRNAVEREKRHIAAKVALLESGNDSTCSKKENAGIDLSTANPKQMAELVACPNLMSELVTSPDQMGELVASSNQMAEVVASSNQMAEVVASPNQMAKVVANPNQMAEFVSSPNQMAEVVGSPNQMVEVVASRKQMVDVVASSNPMAEVIASPDQMAKHAPSPNQTADQTFEVIASPNQMTQLFVSLNETAEYVASLNQTAEPVASPNQTAELGAIPNQTAELVASANKTAEHVASPSETAELVANPKMAEVVTSPSQTSELVTSSNQIHELRAIPNQTAELVESPNQIAEHVASPNEMAELVTSPNQTAELVASPNQMAEHVASPNEMTELVASSNKMTELVASPNQTAELVPRPYQTAELVGNANTSVSKPGQREQVPHMEGTDVEETDLPNS